VDVINGDEFPWTNFPGAGGLTLNEAREALRVFASQPNLAAFVVAGYNPELDSDGVGARKLIDLLADVLSIRQESTAALAAKGADPVSAATVDSEPVSEISQASLPTPRESEPGPEPADLSDGTESDVTGS
jgi:hypothetical protein